MAPVPCTAEVYMDPSGGFGDVAVAPQMLSMAEYLHVDDSLNNVFTTTATLPIDSPYKSSPHPLPPSSTLIAVRISSDTAELPSIPPSSASLHTRSEEANQAKEEKEGNKLATIFGAIAVIGVLVACVGFFFFLKDRYRPPLSHGDVESQQTVVPSSVAGGILATVFLAIGFGPPRARAANMTEEDDDIEMPRRGGCKEWDVHPVLPPALFKTPEAQKEIQHSEPPPSTVTVPPSARVRKSATQPIGIDSDDESDASSELDSIFSSASSAGQTQTTAVNELAMPPRTFVLAKTPGDERTCDFKLGLQRKRDDGAWQHKVKNWSLSPQATVTPQGWKLKKSSTY